MTKAYRSTKKNVREAAHHLPPGDRAGLGRPGRLPGGDSIGMVPRGSEAFLDFLPSQTVMS